MPTDKKTGLPLIARISIIACVLIIVAFAAWAYYTRLPKAHIFIGTVTGVEDRTILARGKVWQDGQSGAQGAEVDVRIKTGAETRFDRNVWVTPRLAAGMEITSDNSMQVVEAGGLADLAGVQNLWIRVTSTGNMYNRKSFTAQTIGYTVFRLVGAEQIPKK